MCVCDIIFIDFLVKRGKIMADVKTHLRELGVLFYLVLVIFVNCLEFVILPQIKKS